MDIFMETIKEVVPVVITGIITFLITKYTYNKNIPLDKLEIAYNRIYYPIYQLLYDRTFEDIKVDIPKISLYFQKYHKYADRATLKAFEAFCKLKDKDALQNFKNNIWNKNSYLRKRLGYLEPGLLQMYIYSSKGEKFFIRSLLELVLLYTCILLSTFIKGAFESVKVIIIVCILIIIILENICMFIYSLRYMLFLRKKLAKSPHIDIR